MSSFKAEMGVLLLLTFYIYIEIMHLHSNIFLPQINTTLHSFVCLDAGLSQFEVEKC